MMWAAPSASAIDGSGRGVEFRGISIGFDFGIARQLFFGELGQAADAVPFLDADQANPSWVFRPISRMSATGVRIRIPRGRRQHHLVGFGDLGDRHHRAVAVGGLDVDEHPCHRGRRRERYSVRIVRLPYPLAQTVQDARRVVLAVGDDHPDDLVVVEQADPSGRRARASHGADVGLVEPDRHALARAQHDLVARLGPSHADELIPLVEPERDDAAAQGRLNAVSAVFLTVPRRVTIIRHSSSLNWRTGIRPVIFSPSANCRRLTIARPPEVRPPSAGHRP